MSLINKDALRQMMLDSGIPFEEGDLEDGLQYLEKVVIDKFNAAVKATKRDRSISELDQALLDIAEKNDKNLN